MFPRKDNTFGLKNFSQGFEATILCRLQKTQKHLKGPIGPTEWQGGLSFLRTTQRVPSSCKGFDDIRLR